MILNDTKGAYWGPRTAKANFCEEDYMVTRYIAELINTLTSLVYILYALYGIRRLQQKSNTYDFRTLPYWALMAVGICSILFHASLKYHTQMLDDISMLFTTTALLYHVLTVNVNRRRAAVIAIILASVLTMLAIYHVRTDEFIIHGLFFALSVTVIGIRTMRLINSRTLADSPARRHCWGMANFGAFIFYLGFSLWLVDRCACGFLRSMREIVGLPWAFLLELHGWWHICTGIGAYVFIAMIDHLAFCQDHKDIPESFAWPAPWASRSIFGRRGPTRVPDRKRE